MKQTRKTPSDIFVDLAQMARGAATALAVCDLKWV